MRRSFKKYSKAIKITAVMASLAAVILFSGKIAAGSQEVIINEIMYNASGSDDKHEWIEIFNAGSQAIDLTGWKINDRDNETNHKLNPPSEKNASRGSIILEPGEFAILADDAATVATDIPQWKGTIIDTVLSLSNAESIIKILNENGREVDSASYSKSLGAAGNGKTLERKSGGWQESLDEGGTPGKPNSNWTNQDSPTPEPSPAVPTEKDSPDSSSTESEKTKQSPLLRDYDYSQDIYLNEFFPYPSSENQEWVEIFNQGDKLVDLTGWQIDDAENSNPPQQIPEGMKIYSKNFLIVAFDKNIFNNDQDQIRLLWPDGQLVHSIAYQKAKKDYSCSRFENQWLWTSRATPGEINQKSTEEQAENKTISSPAPKAQTIEEVVKTESKPKQSVAPSNKPSIAPTKEKNEPSKYLASESAAINQPLKRINGKLTPICLALFSGLIGLFLVWFKRSSNSSKNN